jgi:hypothetical protein
MDPTTTLDRAAKALNAGELDEALDLMKDYVDWRARGGFEPDGGDARLDALLALFDVEARKAPLICEQCNETIEEGEDESSYCGSMHAGCLDEHCRACEPCRRHLGGEDD